MDLAKFRVQEILLVSSLYDSFILAEDGQLNELVLSEFLDLNLRHPPTLTRVSTGSEALARAIDEYRIAGVPTTLPLLRALVDFAPVVDASYGTQTLEPFAASLTT